jgi:hypothetical protein
VIAGVIWFPSCGMTAIPEQAPDCDGRAMHASMPQVIRHESAQVVAEVVHRLWMWANRRQGDLIAEHRIAR